jgi:hypothetical protein
VPARVFEVTDSTADQITRPDRLCCPSSGQRRHRNARFKDRGAQPMGSRRRQGVLFGVLALSIDQLIGSHIKARRAGRLHGA